MQLETRKLISFFKIKRKFLEKLSSKRKLKMGTHTMVFLMLSYYAYMKKLSKSATLNALMDKKKEITRINLAEAHQTILEQTKVTRKQRTLDEMFQKRVKSYKKPFHL